MHGVMVMVAIAWRWQSVPTGRSLLSSVLVFVASVDVDVEGAVTSVSMNSVRITPVRP